MQVRKHDGGEAPVTAQREFLEEVRQRLDHGCEAVDGYTRSRLTAIRHEALAQPRNTFTLAKWLPATGLVTACMLLVISSMLGSGLGAGADVGPVSDDALQDLDILTAEEGLEFFEDYEFYQWLADNESPA